MAERIATIRNGWGMFVVGSALAVGGVILAVYCLSHMEVGSGTNRFWGWWAAACALTVAVGVLVLVGLTVVSPNVARVLLLFGDYRGTARTPGLWWVNPLTTRPKVSVRTRNMTTPTMKVNDIRGNPIEIGAVVVWRIEDTFRATFDVEDVGAFVVTQSESALRHMASTFPYDNNSGEHETTLRGSTEEVNKALQAELTERVAKAGVVIEEARLSHLAYASEIAGAMLRRQQAEAIVAARFKIVEGAVGMVESALEHLERSNKVKLDEERKAAMVSNLLVVLCGDHNAQPVVNAGTLYNG